MIRAIAGIAILSSLLSINAGAVRLSRPVPESGPAKSKQTLAPSDAAGDQVIQWNRTLLQIVRTAGAQPATIHPTRSFAIMHAAIYDAVNAIERTHRPYLVHVTASRHTSADAAAAAAAHAALVALYPAQQTMLDAQLQTALAQISDGADKDAGIRLGKKVARQILAARSNDGASAPPIPYTPATGPGAYQLTPPNFSQPVFTHWPAVTPFTLTSASQFRPGAPPDLTSSAYTAVFQEVKDLGVAGSTARTADQTQIAQFWRAPIWNYWNEIAQTAALANNNTLAQNARLFALLNLEFADGVIAFYDAKYHYAFWRPITAIRAADTDNNPDTIADPNWTPLTTTPLDPAYPGAHSVTSTAAALTLASVFASDQLNFSVTSEVLPGVERSFTSFSAAAEEAGLSRIYAGVHYRSDHTSGQQLGQDIANFVLQNFLRPRGQ